MAPDTAKQIINLFEKIKDITTDSEIEGWTHGEDGETYIIQFATTEIYSFKTYWTPDSFEDLQEAIWINNFVTQVEALLTVNKRTKAFFDSLPQDNCYRFGSMMIMCIQSGKRGK